MCYWEAIYGKFIFSKFEFNSLIFNLYFEKSFIKIGQKITSVNVAVIIVSIITITFLYLAKTQINDRFKDKLPVPIPIELIVLIAGTLVTYLAKLDTKFSIRIVNTLPSGFPMPSIPPLSLFITLIGDIISIAIVSFAV